MRSSLTVTLFVGGITAFMIPPNVALESLTTPAIPMITDPFSIKLVAPCAGCPYAEFNKDGIAWIEGKDNGLFLQVQVNTKSNTIELNGAQIYPPPSPFDLIFGQSKPVPQISQVLSTVSLKDIERNPEKHLAHSLKLTGYSLAASTVHASKDTKEEVIKITLNINSLEGQRIHIAPFVVTALKNTEVDLMVLNVELQKQEERAPCDHSPMLCKFKGLIQSVKHKMHGNCNMAHMGHMGHIRPDHISAAEQHKEDEIKAPHRPHRRPHHHHPHGKMKHHGHRPHHGPNRTHHMHSFLHQVARALITIVVPLLLGILAGMVTYTVGMLLGTFIALIYIRWRSSRNSYQPVALGDEECMGNEEEFDEGFEEKETYHDDAPPTYLEIENK